MLTLEHQRIFERLTNLVKTKFHPLQCVPTELREHGILQTRGAWLPPPCVSHRRIISRKCHILQFGSGRQDFWMLVGVIDHPEQVLSISSNYGHRQTHLLESIIAFNNPITGEKNLYIDTDKTYHIGFRYCQIHSKANRIDKNLSAISNS